MERKTLWLLLPLSVVVSILVIELLIFLDVPVYPFSEEHCGCHHTVSNYLFLLFGILLILAAIPLSYYFSSREMGKKLDKHLEVLLKFANKTPIEQKDGSTTGKQPIMRFLNASERRILERLLEGKGSILQSEVSRTSHMTKLKAHRAVKSLEQKGIITIERYGKTNRIFLAVDIKSLLNL